MVGARDTPPSVQDGPYGYEPGQVSNFESTEAAARSIALTPDTARKLARECFESSTNWLNAGRRARWNDNLRSFQNLHPSGSKYLSRDWTHRSDLFRPKTRATIRKSEAKTASAFFSNQDVISVQAENEDDPKQLASAEFMQALLQYRLTKSVPWFLTLVGARQDADVMGVCVAKAYWVYEERYSHTVPKPRVLPDGRLAVDVDGTLLTDEYDVFEKIKDKPVIDLISPENIRIEPGCDWRDPIGSSPYVIEMVPMYIADVREKMESGEWLKVPESALRQSMDLADDVTRRTRETGRVPGKDDDAWKPRDYDICWVHANIVKFAGRDWQYYTVGGQGTLLTDPRPIEEVYLHGLRPYVLGFTILETHKTYPSGKPELLRDLQRAANEDWNLRFDQLKMALHPRQIVRSGSGLEAQDVKTFIPGKVIYTQDPLKDMNWDRPPNVPPEAYAEADRINLDWGDLVGDMDQSAVRSSELSQQSATGMALMSGEAAGIPEYELRLFADTFVEPLLRLFIKLEEAYETDPVVLALAGKNAQLIQKFGIDRITDDLLAQDLTLTANVGIGATNPHMKMTNFLGATEALSRLFGPALAQGTNFDECYKEIMALAGYKDGERFILPGFNYQQAMAQMAQQGQKAPDQSKVQAAEISGKYGLAEKQIEAQTEQTQARMELVKEMMAQHEETGRARLSAISGLASDRLRHEGALIGHAVNVARVPHPAPPGMVPAGAEKNLPGA